MFTDICQFTLLLIQVTVREFLKINLWTKLKAAVDCLIKIFDKNRDTYLLISIFSWVCVCVDKNTLDYIAHMSGQIRLDCRSSRVGIRRTIRNTFDRTSEIEMILIWVRNMLLSLHLFRKCKLKFDQYVYVCQSTGKYQNWNQF